MEGHWLRRSAPSRARECKASSSSSDPKKLQNQALRIERSVHSSVPVLEEVSGRTYVPLRSTTTTAMGFPLRRFFLSPQRLLFHRLGYWRLWSYLECEDRRGSEIILVGGECLPWIISSALPTNGGGRRLHDGGFGPDPLCILAGHNNTGLATNTYSYW